MTMNDDQKVANMMEEYTDLKMRYNSLCSFIERVEEGSSPIHDDYPVAELYDQRKVMELSLNRQRDALREKGVEV